MNLLIITQKVDKNDENLGAFYYWFEEFAKRFGKITIIASAVGKEDLPGNVDIFSLGKESGRGKFGRILIFFFLFGKNYFKSDLVFFHMIPEFVIAASPFFLFSRRKTALWYAHKSVTWKLKLAVWLVDYIFSSSEAGFRLSSKKVIFTGQAINTELFKPPINAEIMGDKVLKLLVVGRISIVKNIETAIRACPVLNNTMQRLWTLSIIGGPILPKDREYLLFLKRIVKEAGLEDRIKFLVPRPYRQMPSILNQHDFLLNFSKTGSLDKTVLEAMASGLTVLTSTEGYKDILPPRYFISGDSRTEEAAGRIMVLAEEKRPNLLLRNIVLKSHSLKGTIDKIVSILKQQ